MRVQASRARSRTTRLALIREDPVASSVGLHCGPTPGTGTADMADLMGQVALVTGASRGVGRGVALGLAHAGATVFATGRSIEQAQLGPSITAIACDHTDDEATARVFRHVEAAGRLDILVNVAWGGYER